MAVTVNSRLLLVGGIALLAGVVIGVLGGRAAKTPPVAVVGEAKPGQRADGHPAATAAPAAHPLRITWEEERDGDLAVELTAEFPTLTPWRSIELWSYGLTGSGHRIGDQPMVLALKPGQSPDGRHVLRTVIGRNLTHTPIRQLLIASIAIRDERRLSTYSGSGIAGLVEASDRLAPCPDPMDEGGGGHRDQAATLH